MIYWIATRCHVLTLLLLFVQLSERGEELSAINNDLGNAKQELSLLKAQADEQKTTLAGTEAEVKVAAEQLKVCITH